MNQVKEVSGKSFSWLIDRKLHTKQARKFTVTHELKTAK